MIGIIGAGNMGSAIASRIRGRVMVSDADPRKLRLIKGRGIGATPDNTRLARKAGIIILAVKPQDIAGVLEGIRPCVKNKLVISIAAGVGSDFIQKMLGAGARIVRVMPNMPLVAGKGVSAIAKGRSATAKDVRAAKDIFSKMGSALVVEERLMHAVTALSGSGPAYYFLLTDILAKAGAACGLKKGLAEKLAVWTFTGAARLAEDKKISMSAFVKKVASKGGTTEAALKVFKEKNLEEILKLAVKAACRRSQGLTGPSRGAAGQAGLNLPCG